MFQGWRATGAVTSREKNAATLFAVVVAASCALAPSDACAQGTPWATGRLGRGNATPTMLPMTGANAGLTAVAVGGDFAIGLTSNGTVLSWRIPASVEQPIGAPEALAMGAGMTAISAGPHHGLALRNDGSVWTWGETCARTRDVDHAAPVEGLPRARAIAAGDGFSIVLGRDGTVWGWGSNDHAQLGRDPSECITAPVRIEGIGNTEAIAAGGDHVLALAPDGTVWAWGANDRGQLGRAGLDLSKTPLQVPGVREAFAIVAGEGHSLAIAGNENEVFAWGANDSGQIGDGTGRNAFAPVRVFGLRGIEHVAASARHSVALGRDGSLWSWGANDQHQLGTEAVRTRAAVPVRSQAPRETSFLTVGPLETVMLEGSAMALADLSVSENAIIQRVHGVRRFIVTLDVANLGPDPAVAVVVENTLPAGITFTGVHSDRGLCVPQGATIHCTLDRLANGEHVTIQLTATTPERGAAWINHAHVDARTNDPDPFNDESEISADHPRTEGNGQRGGGGLDGDL